MALEVTVKLVCISDTHNLHNQMTLPDGDVLVHAGDFCDKGTIAEIRDFAAWLARQPHKHKIVVAGNHDFPFEQTPETAEALFESVTYLRDQSVVIDGIKFYGSPWQPRFFDWAFNLDRGEPLREKWRLIPDDTDVLVTHGPMHGTGDVTSRGMAVGCEDLRDEIETRIKPRCHIYGHIHESRGIYQVGEMVSINACSLDLSYKLWPQYILTHEL